MPRRLWIVDGSIRPADIQAGTAAGATEVVNTKALLAEFGPGYHEIPDPPIDPTIAVLATLNQRLTALMPDLDAFVAKPNAQVVLLDVVRSTKDCAKAIKALDRLVRGLLDSAD